MRSAAVAAVVIAVTMMLMMPAPPAIGAGGAPPGSPAPGSSGGGASPNVLGNPIAASAVALVPAGLTAVAVFPPFLTPRTLPAIAVIFSEGSQRRKRNTYPKTYQQMYRSQFYRRKPTIFTQIWKKIANSPFTKLWRTISKGNTHSDRVSVKFFALNNRNVHVHYTFFSDGKIHEQFALPSTKISQEVFQNTIKVQTLPSLY